MGKQKRLVNMKKMSWLVLLLFAQSAFGDSGSFVWPPEGSGGGGGGGTVTSVTFGPVGNSSNADAASVSNPTGAVIVTLEPATAGNLSSPSPVAYPGLVSTSTQSWKGNKTNVGTFTIVDAADSINGFTLEDIPALGAGNNVLGIVGNNSAASQTILGLWQATSTLASPGAPTLLLSESDLNVDSSDLQVLTASISGGYAEIGTASSGSGTPQGMFIDTDSGNAGTIVTSAVTGYQSVLITDSFNNPAVTAVLDSQDAWIVANPQLNVTDGSSGTVEIADSAIGFFQADNSTQIADIFWSNLNSNFTLVNTTDLTLGNNPQIILTSNTYSTPNAIVLKTAGGSCTLNQVGTFSCTGSIGSGSWLINGNTLGSTGFKLGSLDDYGWTGIVDGSTVFTVLTTGYFEGDGKITNPPIVSASPITNSEVFGNGNTVGSGGNDVVLGQFNSTLTAAGLNTIIGQNDSITGGTASESVIVGDESTSTGSQNVILGYQNTTTGTASRQTLLGGTGNTSASTNTIIIGGTGTSVGTGLDGIIFIGDVLTSSGIGDNDILIGEGAGTSGAYANVVGVGDGVTVSGDRALAVGYSSTAGQDGIALGDSAIAAANSYAIGENANCSNHSFCFGNSAQDTVGNSIVFGGAIQYNDLYLGSGKYTSNPAGNATIHPGDYGPSPVPSNAPGATLSLAGGRSTGNAAGGALIFKTSQAGSSGNSINALVEASKVDTGGRLITERGWAKMPTVIPSSSPSYSITESDEFITVMPYSGGTTIAAPSPSVSGQLWIVQDIGGTAATNPITITGTINGASNYVINTNFGFVEISDINGSLYASRNAGTGPNIDTTAWHRTGDSYSSPSPALMGTTNANSVTLIADNTTIATLNQSTSFFQGNGNMLNHKSGGSNNSEIFGMGGTYDTANFDTVFGDSNKTTGGANTNIGYSNDMSASTGSATTIGNNNVTGGAYTVMVGANGIAGITGHANNNIINIGRANDTYDTDSIAIGRNIVIESGSTGAIAIGATGSGWGNNEICIGASCAPNTHASAVAVGAGINVGGTGSTIMGTSASTSGTYGTALGLSANCGANGTCIGYLATGGGGITLGANTASTLFNTVFAAGSVSNPITDVYFGSGPYPSSSVTPSPVTFHPGELVNGSGTNLAGANITIAAGRSSGTAIGGLISFQTAPTTQSSGTGVNTLGEADQISANGTFYIEKGTRIKPTSVTGSTYTMLVTDSYLAVTPASGGTAITLIASPATGQVVEVQDASGGALTNNIVISPAAGNINGSASNTCSVAYCWRRFIYNGTQWNVSGSYN